MANDISQIKVGNTTYNIYDATARSNISNLLICKWYTWNGTFLRTVGSGSNNYGEKYKFNIALPIPTITNFKAIGYSGLSWSDFGYRYWVGQSYLYTEDNNQYIYAQMVPKTAQAQQATTMSSLVWYANSTILTFDIDNTTHVDSNFISSYGAVNSQITEDD